MDRIVELNKLNTTTSAATAEQIGTPDTLAGQTYTPRARAVRSPWMRGLMTFLMVLGPGLIVMIADNDAGAVSTYVQAGAQYGTHLMWLLLLLLPVTYFVQEMVARLGIATGEGHAAMIYRRFGKWWGRFSLVDLLAVNFLTLVTEFALITLALDSIGVSRYAAIPIIAVALFAMTATGSYRYWERITILLCLLNVGWLVLAFMSAPPPGEILRNGLVPHIPLGGLTGDLVFLMIAIVGTTIAPWQLFFQQSCVADKRLRFSDLKWARLDTLLGACVTITVAGCMMLVGAAAKRHGISFADPARMATDLVPIAGHVFRTLVLLLMINAAVVGATAISLASSWAYGEVMGWPHSLQKSVRQAPGFYGVYMICLAGAGGIVLIPGAPLQLIIISVQVLAGLMLPSAIIFLQLLLNDKELLGPEFVNKRWNNWINWTIVVLLFGLSLVLAAQVIAPGLLPKL
jgi:Mn2+/Fe2+ NRAMP family transporter